MLDSRIANGFFRAVLFIATGDRSTGTTAPVARFTRDTAIHDFFDLFGIDGFVLHQGLGHGIELVAILFQQAPGSAVALIDDATHLLIDHLGRIGRDIGVLATHAAAEEDLALLFGIHQRTELLGQAPFGHHVARQLGGTHDVVRRTGGHAIEAQGHLLGDTATEQRADLAGQGALAQAVTILFRQEHGHTQGSPAGDDRHLVDRIMLGHQAANDGMTGLMERRVELFLVRHDHGFALGAHHDLVLGQLEFLHLDQALAGTRGKQRGLVDQVGQIGTGEARRTARNHRRLDIFTHRHLAHMYFEDLLTAANIRQTNHYLAVETTGTQQRRIEHVGTVGGGDDDDAIVHLETIHFHQQLVEGLLAFVVTATHAGTTMAADGVDLVDEDDARRMLLRLLEHIAHPGRTDTDEHLDEIRTGNGEERHFRFTGNRLGQQGLAGTRRTHHQDAARDTPAEALELTRITQEFDQLADFFLGLVATGDVSEGGLDLIFREQARLALAEAHGPALAARTALHLAHEEHEHRDDHQDREAGYQQLGPDALLLRLLADYLHVIVDQVLDQAVILDCRTHGLKGGTIATHATDDETIHSDPLHRAILNLLDKLRVIELVGLARAGEIVHHRHKDSGDDQPQDQILCHVVQLATL